jgi:DNA polymerase III alpha subunit (gram-positive type)
VIDLETTSGKDENGFQTNNDIIQIGAILLDKELEVIGEFNSLVKPRETVSKFITELTGITDEAAQGAKPFPEVIKIFEEEMNSKVKNPKNIRFCAWGTYFDIPIIRRLYREYKITYPFSGTAYDIKTLAMLWMSLSDRRTDKLSVESIAKIMNINPEGRYHDAMCDARTEARIMKQIFKDFNNGVFISGKLWKIKEDE